MAKLARAVGPLIALVLLASCTATSAKLDSVQLGMDRPAVVAVLGQPDSTSGRGNIQYLTYYLRSEGGAGQQPYVIRLVDNRVESFGRFVQLLDTHNRPIPGSPPLALGAVMPYSVNTDVVTQLQQLMALRDKGVLNEDEFQRVKQRLLASVD
jgi:hypothetical protein